MQDNILRFTTELNIFVACTLALLMKQDPDVETRRGLYNTLIVTSFLGLVVLPFIAVVYSKISTVRAILFEQRDKVGGTSESMVLGMAFQRFKLGLHSQEDSKVLETFLDEISAGAALWRNKAVVAHMTAAEMRGLQEELEQRLPRSQSLGVHFTDLDSARLILQDSLGIRASKVGQLSGGVSVCLASLTDLGWSRYAGEDFAKRIGLELWASKWHEVMPGDRPDGAHADWGKYANKMEVALILRVPDPGSRDPRKVVPGRNNVYSKY